MLRYITKRLFIFIPTLFAVSLVTFVISLNVPGDPVEQMLGGNSNGDNAQLVQKQAAEKAYNSLRHQLGLDLPVFYFSITNATVSDTLYKIPKAIHRETLQRLSFIYGNWPDVARYYHAIRELEWKISTFAKHDSVSEQLFDIKAAIYQLYQVHEETKINQLLTEMQQKTGSSSALNSLVEAVQLTVAQFRLMTANKSSFKKYLPVIHWYGTKNQYHFWMFGDKPWYASLPWVDDTGVSYNGKGFFRFDFGMSYRDMRPVSVVIKEAVPATMLLSIVSLLLSYLIAVPIGVTAAVKKGSLKERMTTTGLFILYSLPNFWIATILIMFFCGGDFFDWFPAYGLGESTGSFFENFSDTAYHLVLPVLCLSYGSLAFISRQMRSGMLNVIGQDFIRTAHAKGLKEKTIIWKHAFRNSLIPIITLFAGIFPAVISGSFVIESIFSIPGMGQLSLQAINDRNYPVIFTVMMLTSTLTLIGNLIADVLYALADPRISFSGKR